MVYGNGGPKSGCQLGILHWETEKIDRYIYMCMYYLEREILRGTVFKEMDKWAWHNDILSKYICAGFSGLLAAEIQRRCCRGLMRGGMAKNGLGFNGRKCVCYPRLTSLYRL